VNDGILHRQVDGYYISTAVLPTFISTTSGEIFTLFTTNRFAFIFSKSKDIQFIGNIICNSRDVMKHLDSDDLEKDRISVGCFLCLKGRHMSRSTDMNSEFLHISPQTAYMNLHWECSYSVYLLPVFILHVLYTVLSRPSHEEILGESYYIYLKLKSLVLTKQA
jgi:hypothetical protein